MVYSTLFDYDENTGNYKPRLALSWCYIDKEGQPIVTPDGGVDYDRLEAVYGGDDSSFFPIRFELNPDATWSDGVPVTAEDIYFTFDLAADQTRSNHAGALAWVSDLLHKYDSKTGRMTRQGIYTYAHGANEAGYTITEDEKDRVFYFEVNKVLGAITPLVSTVLILPEHVYGPIVSKENPLNNTSPTDALADAYQHPIGCGAFTLDADRTNSQEIVLRPAGGFLPPRSGWRRSLHGRHPSVYPLSGYQRGHLRPEKGAYRRVGQLGQSELRHPVRK